MHFSSHQPPPELAPWVRSIWCAGGGKADFGAPDPIVPDGCVEIVFNLADPFADRRGPQPLQLIAGQMTAPVTAVATGSVDLIGVRFRPGRAGAALRTPAGELRDRLVDASAVVGGAGELRAALRHLPRERRLSHLTAVLARRLGARPMPDTSTVDHALVLIASQRGNVAIERVASEVGITRRHLERRFHEEVGLGAKQLARITRVHAVLRALREQPLSSGAEIAAACGYSDQAHMIRECKALTGRTPARLTTSVRSLARLMREAAADRST